MGFACLFGHKWNGCTCTRCGKTQDRNHDYRRLDGKCEEKCSICGKTRRTDHDWDGCKCRRCGEKRDSGHKWVGVPGKCEEKCSVCGKTRKKDHQFKVEKDENGKSVERCSVCGETREVGGGRFRPFTGTGVCDVCNQPLNGRSAWIVPNHTFYHSQAYRNYMNTHGPAALFGMRMTDADFARMEAQDHSQGSAVCEECIHLFY